MTRRAATSTVSARRPPRRWLWAWTLLIVGGAVAAAILVFRRAVEPPAPASTARVQSAVTPWGDSLRVVVSWELAAPRRAGPDSLRVEVQIDSLRTVATRVRIRSGRRSEDTVYVPAPPPGTSAERLSCVATPPLSSAIRETCTPWRYVRPLASVANRSGRGAGPPALRIVVRPGGLQVDPDTDGRCATWQRRHPGASVWIDVNRRAVPACTGPNDRPTVAQFCAFAELPDGRRVITKNSAGVPYCDALFRAWERERLS